MDEVVDGKSIGKDEETKMDELRRPLAHDVNAEEFLICRGKKELEHPAEVADDLSSCVEFEHCAAGAVGYFLFDQRLFRRSRERYFGNRVDGNRNERGNLFLVFQFERVAHCDARLFHGCRSERRKSDHITRGINIRHRSLELLVNGKLSFCVRDDVKFLKP